MLAMERGTGTNLDKTRNFKKYELAQTFIVYRSGIRLLKEYISV
jgi:hypothetical protein